MLPSFLALAERQLIRFMVGSALVVAAASCSGGTKATPENLIAKNDYESIDGWCEHSVSLSTTKAHSGRFSSKVDREIEYGIGYRNTLLKVSNSKLSKLHVHGFGLVTGNKAKAVLVVQITDPATGAQIFWQALDLKGEIKTLNHWTEFDKDFVLPATITSAQELRVYMWRTSPDDATYLDDLEITKG